MAETQTVPMPLEGEQTKAQAQQGVMSTSFLGMGDMLDLGRPWGNAYDTYRRMRENPTVAVARIAATAPLKAAKLSYDAPDLDDDDERVAFIQSQIDRLWWRLLRDALLALDYGWQPFELVWKIEDGQWTIDRAKPLKPDLTQPVIDRQTGKLEGVKQNNAQLPAIKTLVYTYDGEYGDPFGRSRHENIRRYAWDPWCRTLAKMMNHVEKVAGVTLMLEYPIGKSRDQFGADRDNSELAKTMLDNFGAGKGVAVPRTYIRNIDDIQEFVRNGGDLSKLRAWQFEFMETAAGHLGEFVEALKHYESLMLRGWIVPERAVVEGQFGTKAEAESHGDLMMTMAEEVLKDILLAVNEQVVDPLLLVNFGRESVGSVKVCAQPIEDETANMLRRMVEKIFGDPTNIDLLAEVADVDAMLDSAGLPKRDEVATLDLPALRPPSPVPVPTPNNGAPRPEEEAPA